MRPKISFLLNNIYISIDGSLQKVLSNVVFDADSKHAVCKTGSGELNPNPNPNVNPSPNPNPNVNVARSGYISLTVERRTM